jgi:radical SAM superfamily enzyme YgiQ (UPF0313 family)
MKVILIAPSYVDVYGNYRYLYRKGFLNPPMSLCYLAAALINSGHEAHIIDGEAECLTDNDIIGRIKHLFPNLIALTATSVDFNNSNRLAEKLKVKYPDIPIILGGIHVNIFGSEVMKEYLSFDFCCIGDGEDLIVELAKVLETGNLNMLSNIFGLIWREGYDIRENDRRPIENNIDRYSFPARFLLRNDLYTRAVPYKGYVETTAVMSSRGCPYSCIFCAVKNIYGGAQVRLRSAENVLDEVESIINQLQIHHLSFNDDCLTINRNRIFKICEGIHQRKLKFTWEGLSRADLVDKELLESMHNAGFVRISFGIESGNQNILEILQKKETLEKIEEAIRIAHEVGIIVRGSVIIGNPYETRSTINDTFRFLNNQKGLDQAVINIMQPYPGTKVRDMILKGEGGTRLLEGTRINKNLKRFGSANITVNDLEPQDLVLLQKYGFLRFYLRPRVILNNLRISGWRVFAQDAWGFIRSIL